MNPSCLLRSFHNFSVDVVSHTTWRLSLRRGRPLFERFMFVNGEGKLSNIHRVQIAMIQCDDRIQSDSMFYLYYRKWRRLSARPQCILVECGPLNLLLTYRRAKHYRNRPSFYFCNNFKVCLLSATFSARIGLVQL